MKRIVTGVMLLTLLTFGISPADGANSAAPKGACSRVGLSKTVKAVKYTCVSVKKKLVWNKGVAVKKAPAPIKSAAPSTQPEISPNQRLVNEILSTIQNAKPNGAYKFEVKSCQNTNSARSSEMVSAYEVALKFWNAFYTPSKPMKWVMFSEKDYDCWRAAVLSLEGNSGDTKVWNSETNIMGHCQLSAKAFCGYGTGVKPGGLFVQYNAIGSAYTGRPDPFVVHHEAAHFYQMSLQSENTSTSKVGSLPPWFIEGQANLIGMTTASNGLSTSRRTSEIGRLKNVIENAGSFTAEEWTQRLISLDSQSEFVFRNELGYSLGWIALELVYQKHGTQKMHDLLVAVNKGQTFDEAVKSVLGVTKLELYGQIGVYLAAEIN